MFNLEKQIAEWRRRLMRGGIRTADALAELESHLRAEVGKLVSDGMDEATAFESAKAKVGAPRELSAEFTKLEKLMCWPVKLAWVAWGIMAGMKLVEFVTHWSIHQPLAQQFLHFHMATIMTGWNGILVINAIGFTYVIYRFFDKLTPTRARSLEGALKNFTGLSLALVTLGLIFGLGFNRLNEGRFLHGYPAELQAILCFLWLLGFWLVLKRAAISQSGLVLLFLGSSLAFNLVWCGISLQTNPDFTGRVKVLITDFGPFVGLQILGLVLGMLPPRRLPAAANLK